MFETPFYHGTIKKVVTAFGLLFSHIKIARQNNDGDVAQIISLPIAWAPKDKAIVRSDSDPTLDKHTYISLPRLSFEILGYNYDSTRKVNKMSTISCGNNDGTRKAMYAPVPYNIEFGLQLLTKNSEDAFQVIEQVLPLFTPEYTLSLNVIPEFNLIQDIPIVLNSVSLMDEYDGDFEMRRWVTHTLSFTARINLFNQISTTGVITKVEANINNLDGDPYAKYTASQPTPLDIITETWLEI